MTTPERFHSSVVASASQGDQARNSCFGGRSVETDPLLAAPLGQVDKPKLVVTLWGLVF